MDLTLENGRGALFLRAGDELHGRVVSALFTDGGEGAGWWGDENQGSRLWTLGRRKLNEAARADAEIYAREALAFLLDEGAADEIQVAAVLSPPNRLDLEVVVVVGEESRRFPFRAVGGN